MHDRISVMVHIFIQGAQFLPKNILSQRIGVLNIYICAFWLYPINCLEWNIPQRFLNLNYTSFLNLLWGATTEGFPRYCLKNHRWMNTQYSLLQTLGFQWLQGKIKGCLEEYLDALFFVTLEGRKRPRR